MALLGFIVNSAAASVENKSTNLTIINKFKYTVDKFNDSAYDINRKRRLIVPGSLWCGVGNIAIREDDIGQFHLTDTCCKDRDLCGFNHKEILLHFESKKDVASQLFGKILQRRCLKYQVDTNSRMRIETRDNPYFF
ncbi:hypothetical protein KQX54_002245 [Cotesia glomerata]|uniref:phospholipase A2 n=1 Tax=Cotesia glomerata TaxID=32391 RepID=A0AAV7HVA7_COTGL|nr:hypothetical protein KQX54_002245 [Cotesia glomerata]